MYARLWWKDARQFWPIWVLLIAGAAVIQWMMLILIGPPVRGGVLCVLALLWAGLYALAAGAAAFAAERETGTLHLLDIVPIDRRLVWAGKTSFALVTTIALTVILLVIAAFGTDRWDLLILHTPGAIRVVMIVLVALGWGLFWSSIFKTALAAALSGMCCTGLILVMGNYALIYGAPSANRSFGFVEFAVVIATILASHAFFTQSIGLRRFPIEFRSPIAFNRSRWPRSGRIQARSLSAVVPAPISHENAVMRPLRTSAPARPGRPSWLVETRNLVWQTIKQGIGTWSILLAIAVAVAALGLVGDSLDRMWLSSAIFLLVIAAGVSVFGLENRARSQRFLVHHGVRPNTVWLVKITTWLIALVTLAIIFIGALVLIAMVGRPVSGGNWAAFECIPLAYAVALICGMAFRRGVTAFVVSVMLSFGLGWPLVGLWYQTMMPWPAFLVVAAALIAVSWAWRSDWMLERPAPWRWLRLGAFACAAFALLFAWYIGFRAWSVPDVGPIALPEAWARASSIETSPERNAADLYREAGRLLAIPVRGRGGHVPADYLVRNKQVLDLIRQAAARPECRFDQSERPTLVDRETIPLWVPFVSLMSQEARNRVSHGDLAGAWDDVVVLFRMARHFAEGSGAAEATDVVSHTERQALELALEWALASGQTSERLHKALEAYRNLPKMPPPSEVVRAEANLFENTLDLPPSKLRSYLEKPVYGRPPGADDARQTFAFGMINLVTTPWELTRARRVNRFVSAAALESASREPGHRLEHYWHSGAFSLADPMLPDPLRRFYRPVNDFLLADEQNEVARRALVQVFAIRAWQLKHDGRFPERLDVLVPEELPSLPIDPYSDRPFAFVPSSGARVLSLRDTLSTVRISINSKRASPPPGSWLLYSVGLDRQDNGGIAITDEMNYRLFRGYDIVFAIPPVPGTPAAGKVESQSAPEATSEPAKPK